MTRKPDTGCVRPYRPAPPDFVEVYLRLGQDRAIEEHFRTNWRCITRWIEECGGDELRARRAAITGAAMHPGRRSRAARDYVLGRRTSHGASGPDNFRTVEKARFDPARATPTGDRS